MRRRSAALWQYFCFGNVGKRILTAATPAAQPSEPWIWACRDIGPRCGVGCAVCCSSSGSNKPYAALGHLSRDSETVQRVFSNYTGRKGWCCVADTLPDDAAAVSCQQCFEDDLALVFNSQSRARRAWTRERTVSGTRLAGCWRMASRRMFIGEGRVSSISFGRQEPNRAITAPPGTYDAQRLLSGVLDACQIVIDDCWRCKITCLPHGRLAVSASVV